MGTWTKESILQHLKIQENMVASSMIKDLIASHVERHEKMKQLYTEYRGDVPILKKNEVSTDGPNNQIPHDFRGEIVDQKAGYSYGNPISYLLDIKPYWKEGTKEVDEVVFSKANLALQDFVKMNNLNKLDIRTGKRAGICGNASRLMYLDTVEKKPRIMHLDPWETIFIRDQTIDEVVFAMIYYKMQNIDEAGDASDSWTYVEWYDAVNVTYYIEKQGVFIIHPEKPAEPHGFTKVPVLEFPNKDERQGDFEKVRALINAYDGLVSNNYDEHEAFRQAYLILFGAELTTELIQQMKDTGGIEMPEGGKAEWLTKEINDAFVESTLNRSKSDIYRFSKSVDMSDESFSGGAESGESRKWKLKTLTDDAILKEKEFANSSMQMLRVFKTYTDLFSIPFEAEWVSLQFTPNLPADLAHEAETTSKLKGNVSEKTRLSLLSFIDDPGEELNQMAEEAEAFGMFTEELEKLGITTNNQQ